MKDRQNELMGFAEKTIAYGSKNVDKIEVYIQDHFEIGGEVNLGQINKATKSQDSGVSIRCVIGKRLGSAFTNVLNQATLNQAVDRAIAAAKASTPDEAWEDFPRKSRYPEVKGTWDDAIIDKDPADFVIMALNLTKDIAARDKSIIIGEAGTGGAYGWSAYANSNGISISDRVTLVYAYAELVAPTPTGMTPGVFALDVKRNFNLDLDYVVENSVRDVQLAKQTAKGETGKDNIIMANNALGSLIYYTLIPAIRGENVVRGKSVLAERRGDHRKI